jgi:lipopolysaccharide biosynthesis glycosyltransferase
LKGDKLQDIIPVVLAADENYAMPMGVTMTSIMENANETTFIDFYLLVPSEFSEETKAKIHLIKDKYPNCNITFIDMKDKFSKVKMNIPHITSPTYYRLLVSELLPQYEKCIYLDVDVIVCVDLAELFNIGISEHYIAGVKAPGYHFPEDGNKPYCLKNGLPSIDQYINAGVLLINLKEFRDKNLNDKFLELYTKSFSSQDQDIINLVCYNHIKHLPFKYNVMTERIKEYDDKLLKVFNRKEIDEARTNPFIIHYAHKIKPWQSLTVVMAEYWWKYSHISPFNHEVFHSIANSMHEMQKSLRNNSNKTSNELKAVRNSYSFRIGSIITFIPRMMRDTVICYQQHGLLHTLKRIKERLSRLFQSSKPEIKKDYNYYKNLDPKRYAKELKEWYKKRTGKKLNLKHPKSFNEKIQWMKLFDSTPLKTKLADKYLVRDWVKEKIGEKYLIPLLGVWDDFDDIDFDKLPDKFVLKANHGCGWNIIVEDKNDFDIVESKKKFDSWLNTNFAFKAGFEMHYQNIKPKIIAEQFIQNEDNDLYDYKVWCFNGKPEYIMFLAERQKGLKMAFYDTSWNRLPFVYS